MTFRNPLLLLLLLAAIWFIFRAFKKIKAGQYAPYIRYSHSSFVRQTTGFWFSPRMVHILGYGLAACCLVIALARPQNSFQKIKRNVEGIDIMLVLDLSASMRIEDFRDQNRIDVSKQIIREFILGRQNDKIGFEAFSGEAVTLVPPTLDYSLVLESLKNIEIGDLKDGTAIGDALATAAGRLKESTAKSRIIILLTDGDSNVGQIDPLTAGELAKGYGIKVYSIAIGKDGRVAMPFINKDLFGRSVKTYQYFDSSINPELLKKISESSGGKFYRVENSVDVLRNVFSDINKLEKNTIETHEQIRFEEDFIFFVEAALIFMIVTLGLQYTVFKVYP